MNIPTELITDPKVQSAIHDCLYSVAQVVVIGLMSALGWAVKTWISSMNSSWKQAVARRLVAYAEQKFINNPEKQAYAAAELQRLFPKLSIDEVDHLVEEAVVVLKVQIDKPTQEAPK